MVKEDSRSRVHLKSEIKLVHGDDAPKNECPWGVLHQGLLSVVKLVRSSMPFACSCAAGCFTGSREGKYSSDLCKGEKHIARSCGAYKPEFAFLKYFSFSNPLENN